MNNKFIVVCMFMMFILSIIHQFFNIFDKALYYLVFVLVLDVLRRFGNDE